MRGVLSTLQLTESSFCVFQDFCTDLAASSANFVPTVTAISTSPDLQWMVQPAMISSVAPSQIRSHPYGLPAPPTNAYSRAGIVKTTGSSRGQSIGRRGKVEQVGLQHFAARKPLVVFRERRAAGQGVFSGGCEGLNG